MIRATAIGVLMLGTAPAHACMARIMPQADRSELYSDIITAEVTAVEITRGIIPVGFSLMHNLTVKIHETIKGEKTGTIVLKRVSGCGIPVPEVGQWTTFYLKDKHVVPGRYRGSKKTKSLNIFEKKKSDG